MKPNYIILFFCLALMLSGCSPSPSQPEEKTAAYVPQLSVGNSLKVQKIDRRLLLMDSNSALAADGLYYASWGIGQASPYENSDGDTVDLYEASLYLLLGESKDPASARNNADTWMAAAKDNYEVLEETELTCGDYTYTILTYKCTKEENPYARGVSAFGVMESSALCIELTCQESFEDDLSSLLAAFLENCTYQP